MRTSCLALAVSAILFAAGSAHGPTPVLRKAVSEVPVDDHAPADDFKHRHYMLELAEELHHTIAARHRRLRHRLATRRTRRVEQRKSELLADSAVKHEASFDLAPHHALKTPGAQNTSSLLQLRNRVSRGAPAIDEEAEDSSSVPIFGDEILATWSRQLTPRIASAGEAFASLRVWSDGSPLRFTGIAADAATATPNIAPATVALLDLGSPAVAEGAGRLKRIEHFSRELAERWHCAFVQSFWTVASAEVFDKTFLVAVVCALDYGAQSALQGALAAFSVHLVFALVFGLFASHIVPLSTLHFITAGLFGLLTIFYVNEWFDSSDPRANQFEEIQDDVTKATPPPSPAAKHRAPGAADTASFAYCFFPVFLAEWGDRTQVALIALDATLPILPVLVGGAAALALVVAVAVLLAAIVGRQRVGDHALSIMTSIGLAFFTAVAIWSGIKARALG